MLYEDDNQTYDYLKGKFNKVELSWNVVQKRIIENRIGIYPFQKYQIEGIYQI